MEGDLKGPMRKFSGLLIQAPCTPDCDKRSTYCKRECSAYKKYEQDKFQAYDDKRKQQEISKALNLLESNRCHSFRTQGGHKFKHGRASGNRGQ
jgi:hypothetical protein